MEWLDCINDTLNYIEKNIKNDFSLDDLSKHVCVSLMYLQKSFQVLTGFSLWEYIRNRRLYLAAVDVINTDDKIIDISNNYFYETHESFTKAFTRFHGCTPSELRKNPKKIKTFLPLSIHIEIRQGDKMDYVVVPIWGFKLIGFERVFKSENSYQEIPKFWDEICEKYCNHTIYAGKAPSNPIEQAIIDNCIGEYAVCIDDVGGDEFRYLIAGKYCGGPIPEGLKVIEVPGGEWVKFKCKGPIPKALQDTNTKIWKEWLPNNKEFRLRGNLNIEWYSCDLDQDSPEYESGIWLPIERI